MKLLLPAVLAVLALSGCETMQTVNSLTGGRLNLPGSGSGSSGIDLEKVSQAATQMRKGFEDISESEEYYIGRAVAAQILGRYKPLNDAKLNLYAQTVAQTVAAASDRPSLFKGYHVQLLDTPEVNAFAAPGGFIFVTKGMLDLAKSEDELACVLAHEVAHVAKKHGLKTIQTSRLTSAFAILGGEAAKHYGPEQLAKLTSAFEGAIDDVVNKLVVNGYSRDKEYEADRFAAQYALAAGYDPKALKDFLARMDQATATGGGMFKTHPAASKRVSELGALSVSGSYQASPARDRRFASAARR
jgi:predicted Zn-dependent protease